MPIELTTRRERGGSWGQRATLTMPIALGLVFLGVQYLFLIYIVEVYVPRAAEWPDGDNLAVLWWQTDEHGHGVPAELARTNVLFVLYLWTCYRTQGRRWWRRGGAVLYVGTAMLFLVTQYALLRLADLPVVDYAVRVIELAP